MLSATIGVSGKDVNAVADAIRRLNIFLAALNYANEWGCEISWWNYIVFPSTSSASMEIRPEKVDEISERLQSLPGEIQTHIHSAMYWMREPRSSVTKDFENRYGKMFSARWNAFENVVEAVQILSPMDKLTKDQKKEKTAKYVEAKVGKLTAGDIEEIYRCVVDPGFKAKV